jgi:hypothetical protein
MKIVGMTIASGNDNLTHDSNQVTVGELRELASDPSGSDV